MSQNLSADQQFLVSNLQKMITYIQQETDKKVQLIKKEASKDADLEKALIINPEKEKIAKRMEKELENYKTQMKIAQSQKMNNLRLEKLKVKIDCVNSVFDEAREKLIQRIKENPEEYKGVLKNLLVQGFIKLFEENVNVICKKDDFNLIKELIEPAKNDFAEKIKNEAKKGTSLKLNVTVDSQHFLPET